MEFAASNTLCGLDCFLHLIGFCIHLCFSSHCDLPAAFSFSVERFGLCSWVLQHPYRATPGYKVGIWQTTSLKRLFFPPQKGVWTCLAKPVTEMLGSDILTVGDATSLELQVVSMLYRASLQLRVQYRGCPSPPLWPALMP